MFLRASGGRISASATDGVFHAVQAVSNAASSNLYIDGLSNVIDIGAFDPGAGTFATMGGTILRFGNSGSTGDCTELGIWPGAFNVSGGANASLLNTNQHIYWGF